MRRLRRALGLVVLIVVVWACAGDAPTNRDLGTQPPPPPADQGSWPDQALNDTWPGPSDSYAATPFGCRFDADCFGRRCCPTPWGANLCADDCASL